MYSIKDRIEKHDGLFFIAEIGVNHEGSMEKAKQLIDEVASLNMGAVKFQTYKAEGLAIKNSPSYWDLNSEPTKTQFELFKKHDRFGRAEYGELAKYCEYKGIEFLSTPFDDWSLDILDPMMSLYKIASADITNYRLIDSIAEKGKPIIASTGAATIREIEALLSRLQKAGSTDICLLHCVLNYPTPNENAELLCIKTLEREFPEVVVGYSDHTIPSEDFGAPELAFALGARVIEKHYTYDRELQGNDHYHSFDYADLKRFSKNIREIRKLFGTGNKNLENERNAITYARRSIVSAREIEAGELFSVDNLTTKRPGTGISASEWDRILGKVAKKDVDCDAQIKPGDVEDY